MACPERKIPTLQMYDGHYMVPKSRLGWQIAARHTRALKLRA
jgi:hypothetical protein